MKKQYKKIFKEVRNLKDKKELKRFIKKRKKCPDYIKYQNIPLELESYDLRGKIVVYYNRSKGFEVKIKWNKNRYKEWGNIRGIYVQIGRGWWRNDFHYITA